MSLYQLERLSKGGRWWPIMAAPFPLTPASAKGPEQQYPIDYTRPAFAATEKGAQCRTTVDGSVVNVYSWELIPKNPADPQTDFIWGWELIQSNPLPPTAQPPHYFSVL
jgi:hypothetical protein